MLTAVVIGLVADMFDYEGWRSMAEVIPLTRRREFFTLPILGSPALPAPIRLHVSPASANETGFNDNRWVNDFVVLLFSFPLYHLFIFMSLRLNGCFSLTVASRVVFCFSFWFDLFFISSC